MAIRRIDTGNPSSHSVTDVRIYLDDVEALAKMLASDGEVALTLLRREAPDSLSTMWTTCSAEPTSGAS